MTIRSEALLLAGGRKRISFADRKSPLFSENFGIQVFNRSVMEKMLSVDIVKNIIDAVNGKERIKPEYGDLIAEAMKNWAISHGATHYTHWFQPLTGTTAEKHDAFIDWSSPEMVLEKFSGKQLIQGEPDASSFPSGGLRSTFEARGYTGWDPSSPVFLWKGGDGITLCIPSIFFSWTGDVLDNKIPLLRSEKAIERACLRLLNLCGIQAENIHSTLGFEQEYFVIDRALRNLRPDLVLLGRTVFGASSPKGQELQDHYFGTVKDRVLAYMRDFEMEALKLAIPVKTRHNEVAPAQHEVAPVFEKSSAAIDHNLLLMELMRQIALKHELACLHNEKPFAGLNGSGKHCNWSLATDQGLNLMDPKENPGNHLYFILLMTAILTAVHRHSELLRASIGSAGNDERLGGHEAPPAVISVYLGNALEEVLNEIEAHGWHKGETHAEMYDFGLSGLPALTKDNTDRNRTSPFAFTGNKFEFRALGASANPTFPVTVLNVIVSNVLNQILDEIQERQNSEKELVEFAIPIIQKYLRESKNIRYSGDNYSEAWVEDAEKRGLPNIKHSLKAYETIISKESTAAFQGILKPQELRSRYEILCENYMNEKNIEISLMIEMFKSAILPSALKQQKEYSKSIRLCKEVLGEQAHLSQQLSQLIRLNSLIEIAIEKNKTLEETRRIVLDETTLKEKIKIFIEKVNDQIHAFRAVVDEIETLVDDALWPLPKYRELLFII